MTARPALPVDPDVGIPDLIRSLTDDSKRLVGDEFRLAKLEAKESIALGARGSLWLAMAFGVGVVAAVALTVFLASLIGAIANGNMWAGAMIVGALELATAYWLIKLGIKRFSEPSYSLEESREALKDTATWMRQQRAD